MADDVLEAPVKPPSLSGWMTRMGPGPLDQAAAADVEANKNGGTNGAPPIASPKPDTGQPVGRPAAAAAAAPTPPAAAEPAKPAIPTKPADATADDDDIDKAEAPKSPSDWDKFKTKYKGRTTELRTALEKEAAARKDFETKYADVEKRLAEKPATDPETAETVKRMQALIDEQRDVIAMTEIENEPRFKKHYTDRISNLISDAKLVVGQDKAEVIERLLTLPDSDYKKAQIKAFRDEIDDEDVKYQLHFTEMELRKVVAERETERKNWNEHGKTLKAEREKQTKERQEQFHKRMVSAFDSQLKRLTDPKEGNAMFQKHEGKEFEGWNKSVDQRIAHAKKIFSGEGFTAEIASQVALDAAAYPTLLQAYFSDKKSWQEEKASLEAKIAALSAATPSGAGAGTGAPAGEPPNPVDQTGIPPWQRNKNWAKNMVKMMQPTEG